MICSQRKNFGREEIFSKLEQFYTSEKIETLVKPNDIFFCYLHGERHQVRRCLAMSFANSQYVRSKLSVDAASSNFFSLTSGLVT